MGDNNIKAECLTKSNSKSLNEAIQLNRVIPRRENGVTKVVMRHHFFGAGKVYKCGYFVREVLFKILIKLKIF